MNGMGVSATGINNESPRKNPTHREEVDSGTCSASSTSPEMLLTPVTLLVQNRTKAPASLGERTDGSTVVDECRTVWKWVESGFRKEYQGLRTYFPTIPFLPVSDNSTECPRLPAQDPGDDYCTCLLHGTIKRQNVRLLCAKSRSSGV